MKTEFSCWCIIYLCALYNIGFEGRRCSKS